MTVDLSTLNEKQREAAIHKDGPLLVLAGAGSGKTHTMTKRMGVLVENYGIAPEHILAITFTNKAAREMQERAESQFGEVGKRITISTFHSLCVKLLRKEIRRLEPYNSNFSIFDADDSKTIIKGIVKELGLDEKQNPSKVFQIHINSFKNELLSPEDVAKLMAWDRDPLFITDAKKEFPVYLHLEQSLETVRAIPDVFRAQTLEIYKRYQKKMEANNALDFDDMIFLAVRVFLEHNQVLGYYQDLFRYMMIDEYQDTNHAQYIFAKLLAAKYRNIAVVGDDYQCFPEGTLISTTKGLVPIEEIKEETEVIVGKGHSETTIVPVSTVYKKNYNGNLVRVRTKSGKTVEGTPEHCIFTQSEQTPTGLTLTMFDKKETTEPVHSLKNEDVELFFGSYEECHVFLKDTPVELRATRLAQLTDVKFEFTPLKEVKVGSIIPIVENGVVSSDTVVEVSTVPYVGVVYDLNIPSYHNYTANGIVVHNCIYGFRNANIRNILEFEKDYTEAKVVMLEQNYRSSQNILNLANKVISHNKNQKHKNLWTNKGAGDPVVYRVCENTDMEAREVVREMMRLKLSGRYTNKDFAILYRVNAQSRAFEEELVRNGMAYNVVGGVNFYQRKEIKDIIAYLRLLMNPHDSLSLQRIINSPKRGIGNTTIDKALQFASTHELSLWEAFERSREFLPASGALKIEQVISLFNQLREAVNQYRVGELVDVILEDTGYRRAIELLRTEKSEEAEDRLNNLQEFLNIAWVYQEENEEATLEGFLERIALVVEETENNDEKEQGDNRVTLQTIHGSKGLEYPVVFFVGLEETMIPYYRALDSDKDIEEERRLTYVAITRAKELLYIFRARERRLFNNVTANEPSRFLYDMGFEDKNQQRDLFKLPW